VSTNHSPNSRRAFFLQSGAALGAGVVTAAGASCLAATDKPQINDADLGQQLDYREARDAILDLQIAFTRLVETENYDSIADLFEARGHLHLSGLSANGQQEISQLFARQYRNQLAAILHRAYRPNASRQDDAISVSQDGQHASATFHVDVELVSPLPGHSTAAQMARLQGHQARHWEAGRIVAHYVKSQGHWSIASLTFPAFGAPASG
jgi:SnoaL-like domain